MDGDAERPSPRAAHSGARAGDSDPGGDRAPAILALAVTKRFPGVVADDHVTFRAEAGEVHALLGENGAGKTTLCNVLTGLYRPEEGDVFVEGRQVRFHSPRDAHRAGIFMVHQHFRLVQSMTVAENVVLGWSRRRSLRFSPRQIEQEVAETAGRYRMDVDPRARIWQLSLGEQQRVEILKALYRGARILLLDEPTTVLTPQETDQLFESIRHMAADGSTIVFISHKLPEVTAVSDRVTVLRAGRTVGTVRTAETDAAALARMMVGREVLLRRRKDAGEAAAGEPVLDLEGVGAEGDLGTHALRDVTLTVRAGEILGVAGVAGNGQRELAEVIAGLRPPTGGSIRIAGRSPHAGDPRSALRLGVAYIPEDRMGMGVSPNLSIAENLVLRSYRNHGLGVGPLLSGRRIGTNAAGLMGRFDVRAPSGRTLVHQLSGGNVQRVLLARELSSSPRVLVAASPTRGLDVGATEAVWQLLIEAAGRGVGVLLISEDLDEILDLADRVAVMYEGRVVGVLESAEFDVERIGLMMAGAGVPA